MDRARRVSLDRDIKVIFIPLTDQVIRGGSDIVLVDDFSRHEAGLIQFSDEFPIHVHIEVEGSIDMIVGVKVPRPSIFAG